VLQETFLSTARSRERGFARPEASEEEILHACRTARVDDSPSVSGAVRHRRRRARVKLSVGNGSVSIARAILSDPGS